MAELPQPHEITSALLQETVEQIKKDLKINSFLVDFNQTEPAYDQIYGALLPKVRDLLVRGTDFLPQLLYQVDISEPLANKAVHSATPAINITDLIIRRCFQKVVFRRFYKP